MENITIRALKIAVNLFITLIIATSILGVMQIVYKIYKTVYETDVNINSSFSEFDMYEGTSMNYIEVINTLKKYIDEPEVHIKIGSDLCDDKDKKLNLLNQINSNIYVLHDVYTASYTRKDSIVIIEFN